MRNIRSYKHNQSPKMTEALAPHPLDKLDNNRKASQAILRKHRQKIAELEAKQRDSLHDSNSGYDS